MQRCDITTEEEHNNNLPFSVVDAPHFLDQGALHLSDCSSSNQCLVRPHTKHRCDTTIEACEDHHHCPQSSLSSLEAVRREQEAHSIDVDGLIEGISSRCCLHRRHQDIHQDPLLQPDYCLASSSIRHDCRRSSDSSSCRTMPAKLSTFPTASSTTLIISGRGGGGAQHQQPAPLPLPPPSSSAIASAAAGPLSGASTTVQGSISPSGSSTSGSSSSSSANNSGSFSRTGVFRASPPTPLPPTPPSAPPHNNSSANSTAGHTTPQHAVVGLQRHPSASGAAVIMIGGGRTGNNISSSSSGYAPLPVHAAGGGGGSSEDEQLHTPSKSNKAIITTIGGSGSSSSGGGPSTFSSRHHHTSGGGTGAGSGGGSGLGLGGSQSERSSGGGASSCIPPTSTMSLLYNFHPSPTIAHGPSYSLSPRRLFSIGELLGLFAMSFSYAFCFNTINNIVIPKEIERLTSTRQSMWVGLIMASGALSQLATPVVGAWSDLIGQRTIFLVYGTFVTILGVVMFLIVTTANDILLLFLSHVITTVGLSVQYSMITALLNDCVSEEQTGKGSGTMAILAILGSGAGYALFALNVPLYYSYCSYILANVFCLGICVMYIPSVYESGPPPPPPSLPTINNNNALYLSGGPGGGGTGLLAMDPPPSSMSGGGVNVDVLQPSTPPQPPASTRKENMGPVVEYGLGWGSGGAGDTNTSNSVVLVATGTGSTSTTTTAGIMPITSMNNNNSVGAPEVHRSGGVGSGLQSTVGGGAHFPTYHYAPSSSSSGGGFGSSTALPPGKKWGDVVSHALTIPSPSRFPDFFYACLGRAFFNTGLAGQVYLVYYLRDVLHAERPVQVASIFAVLALFGGVVGALPSGIISDRIGKKPVIYGSIVVCISSLVLFLSLRHLDYLHLVGFGYGIGNVAYLSVDYALGVQALPKKPWTLADDTKKMVPIDAARDLGVFAMSATVGQLFGQVLYGTLLDQYGSMTATGTMYAASGFFLIYGLAAMCFLGSAVATTFIRGVR